jgi:hypothetical protein
MTHKRLMTRGTFQVVPYDKQIPENRTAQQMKKRLETMVNGHGNKGRRLCSMMNNLMDGWMVEQYRGTT